MKQEGNIYTAEKGKLIVRIADNYIMGDAIDLGSADSIENYEERDFTEEEMRSFWESLGMGEYYENMNKTNETEETAEG